MEAQTSNVPVPMNENEIAKKGSLRPVTSSATRRYENKALVEPIVMEISAGSFTTFREPEPGYLAPLWSAHVHPEGQLYFFRAGPLRVLTEAYLYRPEVFEIVCSWIEHIECLLSDVKVTISENVELFVELDGPNCAYYFVDHATCAQFWLENCDTDSLGLPTVTSTSQLKIVLEELYWVHVEHFPMHLQSLPSQKLEEIIAIFSHGLCDQMTSRVSTFPYPAQDCKIFVEILQGCRGNMDNGHTTWIIARLWSVIDNNKCLTFYGEEHSRLSRNQSVLWDPEQKHPWVSIITDCLTFHTSNAHRACLDDIFVDHMVYADRWAQLIGDFLKQWRASGSGAFAGLVTPALLSVEFSLASAVGGFDLIIRIIIRVLYAVGS
ncbi:hypothetical protein K438DRAFT_2023553 [Mycena galopus ATCC 62051]|nr:hypothetical protein K438DRAFT_2023553 [Mycena galopus ATCC 62051]